MHLIFSSFYCVCNTANVFFFVCVWDTLVTAAVVFPVVFTDLSFVASQSDPVITNPFYTDFPLDGRFYW